MNAFKNREEYLAAVAVWKADYKQLSADIRAAKNALKESMRSKQRDGGYISTIYSLKSDARQMLEDRAASKVEAQRQYMAAKV